jgi:site-specific DNA-adenine methylase
VTVRFHQAGFEALATSSAMRAVVNAAAERVIEKAKVLAEDFRVTGDYIDSFQDPEEDVISYGRPPYRRAVARVRNTSDHAASVEWGNEHSHHAHHVLERAVSELDTSR